ncbi:uncharacterized protein LOC130990474 [Salvia miltiorrhiza]|uniref:uncharacterized protein LOC130990474 n=1 Tax=Salvia miltiorrhiza TaxID=226208 RepID=UPI0025AC4D6F|nr:uncharacterized protein LOC130990474 [Salvia miltiorrhiza]
MTERREENEFALIWKTPASATAITTAWKVLKGRLPTVDNLRRRQVVLQPAACCVLCNSSEESIDHLFFSCHKSDEIWKSIFLWIDKQSVCHTKAKNHLNAFINLGNKDDLSFLLQVWIGTVWCIWKWRNDCIFNQGNWNKERVVSEIKAKIWSWLLAFNLPKSPAVFNRWFNVVSLLG